MPESSDSGRERIIAYCATCREVLGDCPHVYVGQAVRCPNESLASRRHLARVVRGRTGLVWLRVEHFVLSFERRYSPRRWFGNWGGFFVNRAGLYVLIQIAVSLAMLLLVASRLTIRGSGMPMTILASSLSLLIMADCIIGNTSVAFVSRYPVNYLRTTLFALGSYLAILVGFATLYAGLTGSFHIGTVAEGTLTSIQALYFSFVTATTLGYGDIAPAVDSAIPQVIVVLQLVVSLYYLVTVIAVVASWANAGPVEPEPHPLETMRLEIPSDRSSKTA